MFLEYFAISENVLDITVTDLLINYLSKLMASSKNVVLVASSCQLAVKQNRRQAGQILSYKENQTLLREPQQSTFYQFP